MKAERINKDQIRFVLSKKDLQDRELKVSELSYGSDKTKALFEDMMHTARDQFGFEAADKPLMIEAIPLSEDSLMITVTKVSGTEEMGALFGGNVPDVRAAEELRREEGMPAGVRSEILPERAIIYVFDSFELLCKAAAQTPADLRLQNSLYKEEDGTYYLVVHYKKFDARIKYFMTMLTEYYSDVMDDQYGELMVKEHCQCVIKARAMQKLAAVEQQ